jgi:hypothetical protein
MLAHLYEQIRIQEMQIKSLQADSICHKEECLTQLALLNCPHGRYINLGYYQGARKIATLTCYYYLRKLSLLPCARPASYNKEAGC